MWRRQNITFLSWTPDQFVSYSGCSFVETSNSFSNKAWPAEKHYLRDKEGNFLTPGILKLLVLELFSGCLASFHLPPGHLPVGTCLLPTDNR